MKKPFIVWQTVGFVFVSVLGTLLHFLYDWANQSTVAGLFSAVNESIWEHMKLLYVPTVAFAIFESRVLKETSENFWCVKLIGLLLGLFVIPVIYYTYTGILGVSADWFNIAIFFIAVAVGFGVELLIFNKEATCKISKPAAILAIAFIGFAFLVFTFSPPKIPLFQDPINGTFGIQ
jgi:hypothetical protein